MKDMNKKNLIEICNEQTNYTIATSRATLDLFCEIMGLPKSKVNYFIGDDPHGVADIMEGYYCFNMSDIHVVLKEYERWLKIYGDNKGIRKAVEQWYYWSLDWHQKHRPNEWNKISQERVEIPDPKTLNLPELDMDSKMEHKRYSKPVLIVDETDLYKPKYSDQLPASVAMYDYDANDWWLCELGVYYHDTFHVEITHWKYIDWPDDTYCPNLRSWLSGCPVPGLREATPEWEEQQRKAQEVARQRVEECKQALYQAMEEEVKLNKF